jgi:alpha-beta hydrolase superfamily lysophospholipase
MTGPRASALSVSQAGGPTRAVALVLHGGRARSTAPATDRQAAVLRMRPFATALHRAGGADGLTVARLRYELRGWNGEHRSPVRDAEQALDQLSARFPGVPIALVGHSMGGRAAVYAAGYLGVRAVVGLAPWLEAGDPVAQLAGRRVLLVHGTRDRMTSAAATVRFAERAGRYADAVTFVSVEGGRHAMLARATLWHSLVAGFVTGVLLGEAHGLQSGTTDAVGANVIRRALAGQASLVV